MNQIYKVFISAVIFLAVWFNFFKILSLTGIWFLFSDNSASTTIVNDTQEAVWIVNVPEPIALNIFYDNLFYANAFGKIDSEDRKIVIFPHDKYNQLLISIGNEFRILNLKYEDWGKEKFVSNSELLLVGNSSEISSLLKIKKQFGLKVLISIVVLFLTLFAIYFAIYKKKRAWTFEVSLLSLLALIHFVFFVKEFSYLFSLF